MKGNRFAEKMGLVKTEEPQVEAEIDDEAVNKLEEGNLARPANKTLPRFHVMTKNGNVSTFIYHELTSQRDAFRGSEFTLLFVGAKHYEVTVTGSGPLFWKVFDYITLFRWPFIVESTRGHAAEGETVFESVVIKDVTPKAQG